MKPRGLLQLTSKDPSNQASRVTIMDFEEEELIKFYNVIENIQEKLDKVYKE